MWKFHEFNVFKKKQHMAANNFRSKKFWIRLNDDTFKILNLGVIKILKAVF